MTFWTAYTLRVQSQKTEFFSKRCPCSACKHENCLGQNPLVTWGWVFKDIFPRILFFLSRLKKWGCSGFVCVCVHTCVCVHVCFIAVEGFFQGKLSQVLKKILGSRILSMPDVAHATCNPVQPPIKHGREQETWFCLHLAGLLYCWFVAQNMYNYAYHW